MKVLLTGATGLLGRAIYQAFKTQGVDVVGQGYTRASGDIEKVNLLDDQAVAQWVTSHMPDYIIHTAAERNPDVCENDEALTQALNVTLTEQLSRLSQEVGAKIIYISTDYVFDGSQPPYQVADTPNPLNAYGESKLAGERVVLESPENITLRVPVLYGPIEDLFECSVSSVAKVFQTDAPVKMDNWATRYPTNVQDIADVILQMVKYDSEQSPLAGVYHWSALESMTKYEMALKMADALGLPSDHIQPDNDPDLSTPRPKDCYLDSHILRELGIAKDTPYKKGVANMLTPYLDALKGS